jgi:hypothetical protein
MNKLNKTLAVASLLFTTLVVDSKAAAVTWNVGEVFIGFESSSLNKNLLIDIGPGTSVAAFTGINAAADLATAFGAGWYSVSDLNWGAFSVATDKHTLWGTVASGNSALVVKSVGALANPLARFNGMGANYNNDIATQGGTVGVIMNVGTGTDTGTSTWSGNTPNTTPFGAYSVSIENGVTGGLDLYSVPNSGSATAIFSQALGNNLYVNSSGFIGVAAVPEPSTYALMALGGLVLLMVYRRKVRA